VAATAYSTPWPNVEPTITDFRPSNFLSYNHCYYHHCNCLYTCIFVYMFCHSAIGMSSCKCEIQLNASVICYHWPD